MANEKPAIYTTTHKEGLQITQLNLLKYFFGVLGVAKTLSIIRSQSPNFRQGYYPGEDIPEKDAIEYMDGYFFNKVQQAFPFLNNDKDALDFYRIQMNRANKFILYLLNNFDLPKNILGFKNEADTVGDSPSSRMLKIPDIEGVNPKLRKQLLRQMLLAYEIAPFDERAKVEKFESHQENFQNYLDEVLFLGKTGDTTNIDLYSEHDNKTNTVLGWGTSPDIRRKGENSHIKKIGMDIRKTDDIDVLTNFRHKGENEALEKAIFKAMLSDSHGINAVDSVRDSIGMYFMVLGTNGEKTKFVNKLKKIIRKYKGFKTLRIDNTPNNDRGQNTSSYKSRIQVYFEGLSVPYEIIIYSPEEYINSEYEIGNNYEGRGHDLFAVRRSEQVLKFIVGKDFDIDPFVLAKKQSIAESKFKKDFFSD